MSQARSSEGATPLFNAGYDRSIPVVAVVPQSAVFAHQGGWDEFLLVAAPLGVIGVLLWIANKRVSAKLEEAKLEEAPSEAGPEGNDDAPCPTARTEGNDRPDHAGYP